MFKVAFAAMPDNLRFSFAGFYELKKSESRKIFALKCKKRLERKYASREEMIKISCLSRLFVVFEKKRNKVKFDDVVGH